PAGLERRPSTGGAPRGADVRPGVLARSASRYALRIVRHDGGSIPAGARRKRAVRCLGAVRLSRRAGVRRAAAERRPAAGLPRLLSHAPRARDFRSASPTARTLRRRAGSAPPAGPLLRLRRDVLGPAAGGL